MYRIAFICSGNTCRSAMAQYIMRSLVKKNKSHFIVDSFGLCVVEHKMNTLAKNSLKKFGYHVTSFKPKQIDLNKLKEYNLIVVMTYNLKKQLAKLGVSNVYTFDDVASVGEITDPYGLTQIDYDVCCKQLIDGCNILLNKLIIFKEKYMKVAIGCDHAGFQAKKEVIAHLQSLGYIVKDFGTYSEESCDYPDYALPVCNSIKQGEFDKGILICGTGIGVSITANKVKGIRCALCSDLFSTEMTRKHNNANVLAMGARVITVEQMIKIVDVFLTTEFEGGRHQNRLDKLTEIENNQ